MNWRVVQVKVRKFMLMVSTSVLCKLFSKALSKGTLFLKNLQKVAVSSSEVHLFQRLTKKVFQFSICPFSCSQQKLYLASPTSQPLHGCLLLANSNLEPNGESISGKCSSRNFLKRPDDLGRKWQWWLVEIHNPAEKERSGD